MHVIIKFPPPQKQKHLLGFLGALNYYRRSLPHLNKKSPAQVLQPLYEAATTKLQRASFIQHWTQHNLEESFNEAKQLLTKAVELAHPDPTAPLSLTTDASKTAIGGVLEQYAEGTWQPLGFWSKSLKPDKQAWTTFLWELFAIQQAVRHFLPDFEGRHLIIYTDHKALLGAFKSTSSQDYDPIAKKSYCRDMSMDK